MQLEPYLSFDGNCEEALEFYKSVFGGEITGVMRFEGAPGAETMPVEDRQRIMRAKFKTPTLSFMASDGNQAREGTGNRVTLALASHDPVAMGKTFEALAAGGTIGSPYGKAFWGAMFGYCTDKFGIDWMVNAELPA